MLAVSIYFGERRTGAFGVEAVREQLQSNFVRLGLRAADHAACRGLFDHGVFHRSSPYVVVPAQEGSRAEQAPKGAIVEGGKRFREGSGHAGRGRAPRNRRRALSRSGPAEAEPDVRHGSSSTRPGRETDVAWLGSLRNRSLDKPRPEAMNRRFYSHVGSTPASQEAAAGSTIPCPGLACTPSRRTPTEMAPHGFCGERSSLGEAGMSR